MKKDIAAIVTMFVCFIALAFVLDCRPMPPATPWQFKAELSGANEIPPIMTPAKGICFLGINPDSTILTFELSLSESSNLLALAGAHLHFGDSASNGAPIAFLAGPVPGGFDGDILIKASLTSDNIINVVGGRNIKEVVENIGQGLTYVNVHSAAYQAGEIRGQVGQVRP